MPYGIGDVFVSADVVLSKNDDVEEVGLPIRDFLVVSQKDWSFSYISEDVL